MDIFKVIIKGTIATYVFVAWLYVAIPLGACIYYFTYYLARNFLATLSIL